MFPKWLSNAIGPAEIKFSPESRLIRPGIWTSSLPVLIKAHLTWRQSCRFISTFQIHQVAQGQLLWRGLYCLPLQALWMKCLKRRLVTQFAGMPVECFKFFDGLNKRVHLTGQLKGRCQWTVEGSTAGTVPQRLKDKGQCQAILYSNNWCPLYEPSQRHKFSLTTFSTTTKQGFLLPHSIGTCCMRNNYIFKGNLTVSIYISSSFRLSHVYSWKYNSDCMIWESISRKLCPKHVTDACEQSNL